MIVGELGARPAGKGQYGYGFVLNCSRNDVVCHGVPFAQFEHMVAVTRDGARVLTLRPDEAVPGRG